MRFVLSPTKTMRLHPTDKAPSTPRHMAQAEQLMSYLKSLSPEAVMAQMKVSESVAHRTCDAYRSWVPDASRGTPAIRAYDGLQYQYLDLASLGDAARTYLDTHMRIISGLYGLLTPTDGIMPYRLEMQLKLPPPVGRLYDFWGEAILRTLLEDMASDVSENKSVQTLVLLTSNEYSKVLLPYLACLNDTDTGGGDGQVAARNSWAEASFPKIRVVTCTFKRRVGGALKVQATAAKMARGQLMRFAAEIEAQTAEALQAWQWEGFHFDPQLSSETAYVFVQTVN